MLPGSIETHGRAGSFVSAAGEQARRAASDYAAMIASVGIDASEAIRIVQAALASRHDGTDLFVTRHEITQSESSS